MPGGRDRARGCDVVVFFSCLQRMCVQNRLRKIWSTSAYISRALLCWHKRAPISVCCSGPLCPRIGRGASSKGRGREIAAAKIWCCSDCRSRRWPACCSCLLLHCSGPPVPAAYCTLLIPPSLFMGKAGRLQRASMWRGGPSESKWSFFALEFLRLNQHSRSVQSKRHGQ